MRGIKTPQQDFVLKMPGGGGGGGGGRTLQYINSPCKTCSSVITADTIVFFKPGVQGRTYTQRCQRY